MPNQILNLSGQDNGPRNCVIFYKFKCCKLSPYLFQLIPQETHSYNTPNSVDIPIYCCRTDPSKNSFFPWTIGEWNKLDLEILKSTYSVFRKHLCKVIRPQPSATFNSCNCAGLCLLKKVTVGLSHLNEHRFNHNFQKCTILLFACSLEVKSACYFPQHCLHERDICASLLNELKSVDEKILKLSDIKLNNFLLYGDPQIDSNKNTISLNTTIKYIKDSGRFTVPLV